MSHLSYTDSTSVARPPDWRDKAACLDLDVEEFFPIGIAGSALQQIEKAKAVCWYECPVRVTCLNYAIDTRIEFGIYGGFSETERRSMKRRNSRGRRTLGGQPVGEPGPPHKAELVDSAAAAAAVRAATVRMSIRKIAALCDTSQSTIQSLATGRREQVLDETADRILAALAAADEMADA